MPLLFAFLMLLIFPMSGWACSCGRSLLCPSMQRSSAIFVGRVMEETGMMAQFTIEERFKGVAADVTSMSVMIDPPCDGGFGLLEVGKRYVVFVSQIAGMPYVVNCGMTGPTESSASAIEFLRTWMKTGTPSLRGGVTANRSSYDVSIDRPDPESRGLADVAIQVTASDGSSFTTHTDGRGTFSVDRLAPGRYSVAPALHGYEPEERLYEISVLPNACTELNISMWNAARISGTIFHSNGNPAPNIAVELARIIKGETLAWPKDTTSDQEGRFEFRRVPDGTYVVGVNILGDVRSSTPYPPRYYSDADTRASAQKIEISGPAQLDNLSFRLPERMKTRDVELSFIWWDGRPVTNVSVLLANSGDTGESLWLHADNRGSIRCSVLAHRRYELRALLQWAATSSPFEDTVIESGDSPVRIEFVIPQAHDKQETVNPSNLSHSILRVTRTEKAASLVLTIS